MGLRGYTGGEAVLKLIPDSANLLKLLELQPWVNSTICRVYQPGCSVRLSCPKRRTVELPGRSSDTAEMSSPPSQAGGTAHRRLAAAWIGTTGVLPTRMC